LTGGRPVTIARRAAITTFWILVALISLGVFWGWFLG
jgi:hypothetical protein